MSSRVHKVAVEEEEEESVRKQKQQCVIWDNTTRVGISAPHSECTSYTVLASGFFPPLFMLFLARHANILNSGCSGGKRGSDPEAFQFKSLLSLKMDANVWYFIMIRTYCFSNVQNIVLL